MGRHPVMVRQVCRLHPFESDPQPSLRMVAEVLWLETGLLELTFNLQANHESDALKNLKASTGRESSKERQDNLWKHTCFEAFFALFSGSSSGSLIALTGCFGQSALTISMSSSILLFILFIKINI